MIKTVLCVDASDRKYLTAGDEYEVVAIQDDGDYVVLDDRDKEVKVRADRFEDLDADNIKPYVKQVICIDSDGRKYLTLDKIYNVNAIQSDGDYVLNDDRRKEVKVRADRFVDVTITIDEDAKYGIECAKPIPAPQYDPKSVAFVPPASKGTIHVSLCKREVNVSMTFEVNDEIIDQINTALVKMLSL